MKTFKIHSAHDIYIDDYEQGELDRVNGYTVTNEVEANDVWEAYNSVNDLNSSFIQ